MFAPREESQTSPDKEFVEFHRKAFKGFFRGELYLCVISANSIGQV